MLRFAPAPTADISISSLRVALVNYVVSQQKNDQFSVRIEDLESNKNIEGKDTEIMMILEKFALKHTSVFHQSEHLNLYQVLALRLLKEKKAFLCTCTTETSTPTSCSGECKKLEQEDYATLKDSNKKFVIRLQPSVDKKVADIIIVKEDGIPSYDFACASDDMMSDITMVIRDEKYLLNTEPQVAIKKLLGYEKETEYIHLPPLLNSENISVKTLLQEGFIPDAILNYLLPLDNEEASNTIFHLPEAIKSFKLETILKSNITFDKERLKLINREHLKRIDDKQLSTLFGFADADIGKLAKLYLEEECSTINELEEKIRTIFKAKDFSGALGKEMKTVSELIASAPAFETFDKLQKYLETKSGLEEDKLTKVLQELLTGAKSGAPLSDIYPLIKSYILEVAS